MRRHHLHPAGEGRLYLATATGIASRRVTGHAMAESFFSAIKGELPDDHARPGRTTARHAVTGYIA